MFTSIHRFGKPLHFAVGLLFTLPVLSQNVGIKAGLSLADCSASYKVTPYNYITGHKPKPFVVLGLFTDIPVGQTFFFRPGIEIVGKGTDETYHSGSGDYRAKRSIIDLDFPLNAGLRRKTKRGRYWLFGGGVAPGIVLNFQEYKKFDFGLNVFTGYEWPIGFSINLNYTHGLKDITDDTYYFSSLRNRYLGITLGYKF